MKRTPESIAKQMKTRQERYGSFVPGGFTKGTRPSPNSEFKKGHKSWNTGKKRPELTGPKHPMWKGGVTQLIQTFRNTLENKKWSKDILYRDNFTCQECFIRGGKLEAHHKKMLSVILQEFLSIYNQFSPIEDKETLIRLSFSYAPFWDLNNGITLCEICHDKKRVWNNNRRNEKGQFV